MKNIEWGKIEVKNEKEFPGFELIIAPIFMALFLLAGSFFLSVLMGVADGDQKIVKVLGKDASLERLLGWGMPFGFMVLAMFGSLFDCVGNKNDRIEAIGVFIGSFLYIVMSIGIFLHYLNIDIWEIL